MKRTAARPGEHPCPPPDELNRPGPSPYDHSRPTNLVKRHASDVCHNVSVSVTNKIHLRQHMRLPIHRIFQLMHFGATQHSMIPSVIAKSKQCWMALKVMNSTYLKSVLGCRVSSQDQDITVCRIDLMHHNVSGNRSVPQLTNFDQLKSSATRNLCGNVGKSRGIVK